MGSQDNLVNAFTKEYHNLKKLKELTFSHNLSSLQVLETIMKKLTANLSVRLSLLVLWELFQDFKHQLLHRLNGLRLWLPALEKSILEFLQAIAFQLSVEGRILFLYMRPSSVSQSIPSIPSHQRLLYTMGKNPRLALSHRALI